MKEGISKSHCTVEIDLGLILEVNAREGFETQVVFWNPFEMIAAFKSSFSASLNSI